MPGAYPGDVLATVDRLAANWLLDPATSRRLRTPASPAEENQEGSTLLPDPHPLDYDWRWDPRTVRMLLARCIRATRPGETIALLGTPTLLAAAAGHYERHWLLLEASEATAAALASTDPARVVRCDLAVDELPLLHAQAVVADPPWYPADTQVFMWAAARLSVPGAVVLLAQPTPATRPGVLDERASILSFAHRTGLDVTGLHPAALAYTSPPFERAALDAAGLLALVPLTWRRGDLIELRRTASPPAAVRRHSAARAGGKSHWTAPGSVSGSMCPPETARHGIRGWSRWSAATSCLPSAAVTRSAARSGSGPPETGCSAARLPRCWPASPPRSPASALRTAPSQRT